MSRREWPNDPTAARRQQAELAHRVITTDDFKRHPRTIAGLDVAFPEHGRMARAAIVVVGLPELVEIERSRAEAPVSFPYVPGLLSFREAPVLIDALQKLQTSPELLLCDGQGIAHPRRFGLACHLGVLTGLPAIGAAKSRLIGEFEPPGRERGARSPLCIDGEPVGAVLRTRTGVRPLFISPGHRIGTDTAVDLVLECGAGYRLPEPTRRADKLAGAR